MRPLKNVQFLFKVKESENLNHPDRHRDRHPYLVVFLGLTFERDTACPAILPAIALSEGGSLGARPPSR